MADMAFISAFLAQVEGPCQTRGYIPCRLAGGGTANYRGGPNPELYTAMGASGVTIATGCDLGQTSAAELRAYGLAGDITARLAPYFGLKKDAAIRRLHAAPLEISPKEAQALDLALQGGYLARHARPAFERASGHSFDSLPREAQAVVMSVCFQKGCAGVARDWPKTWAYLASLDWPAAARELENGFVKYVSRRRAEARLLAGLAKGQLAKEPAGKGAAGAEEGKNMGFLGAAARKAASVFVRKATTLEPDGEAVTRTRPREGLKGIGWIAGFLLAWHFLIRPVLAWHFPRYDFPALDFGWIAGLFAGL